MKATLNIIASPLVIIALYVLLGSCSIFDFPFTAATATCSGGELSPGDSLATARDKVFADLIANTFWNSYSQYCTYYTATGTTSTLYGLANCAASKKCGANYCSTEYQDCSQCLSAAQDRFVKECGDRVAAGFVEITDEQQLQQCTVQIVLNTKLCR